jgi:Protein of unknown function (DUF4038)/Domain of unknown function (DUF5060)/Putative collagen-binding domain of a collagenase/Beta-galactosidase
MKSGALTAAEMNLPTIPFRNLNPRSKARLICLGLALALSVVKGGAAAESALDPVRPHTWQRWEHALSSSGNYDNPYRDVTLRVTYTGPGGRTLRAYGFWDGGSTFRIRCAFPEPGTWQWQTECSDRLNAGLQGQTGRVNVLPCNGNDFLYRHGFLKVSDNRRYLVLADATPFLWIGDTAWAGPLRASDQEWQEYLADRAAKHFTVIQIAPAPAWAGATDRQGQKPFTDQSCAQWNPAYWQAFERKVQRANEQGLVVALVGLMEPVSRYPGSSEACLFARNIVARLFGNFVVFSPSFDSEFMPLANEVGRAVRDATAVHLITQHPGTPWNQPTPTFSDRYYDEPYLDIAGVQTGHNGGHLDWCAHHAMEWVLHLYRHEPHKPVINLEAMYDAQGEKSWRAVDARSLAWRTWLSGASGYTYGAGDVPPKVPRGSGAIWKWVTDPEKYDYWKKALQWASAFQMQYLHDLLAALEWWRLRPASDLVRNQPDDITRRMVLAKTGAGDLAVAYLPNNDEIDIDLSAFPAPLRARWFDPRHGDYTPLPDLIANKGIARLSPPAKGDWVLLLQKEANSLRPWSDYRTIMWIGDTAYKDPARLPLFFQRLREMGINTAMVYHDGDLRPLLESRFPYYVENIINRGLCLKYNSRVTDWDRFVTAWAKTRDEASLVRDYSLDDPQWRQWARDEMGRLVRKNRAHQPLAYNIRDELSVTISANPFDYDFSTTALDGFRQWLRTQYRDLAALNQEWQTAFGSWPEVRPFTTDQIKARMASNRPGPEKPDWAALEQLRFNPATARQTPTRFNFAPWADFRSYMDLSLARTLDDLRQTAHALDPHTPVGIEGTQMPSAFGGYDLWRLSQALDWVEPYDIGNAREIFGSFLPGKPVLTTVFEKDANAAARRLWHLLLVGDRGCLVWWSEDCLAWNTPRYDLTPKARALAPVLREMTSPLAQLFLRATPESDPIAIHYSQPSIQADWLLESTRDGSTWLRRFSSFEADHNWMVRARNSWLKALQDLGYSPRFISSEEIERGDLIRGGCRGLVLPGSLALSDKEAEQITAFAKAGGSRMVLCNGIPGLFDAHAKLREQARPALFASSPAHGCSVFRDGNLVQHRSGDIAEYAAERLREHPSLEWPEWIKAEIKTLPLDGSVPLSALSRIHRYRLGAARLIAVERNVNYQMSEDLKQAGGNQRLEQAVTLQLSLAKPAHVYDLRRQTYLGWTDRVAFRLDPWRPSLFALLDREAPSGDLVRTLLQTGNVSTPKEP